MRTFLIFLTLTLSSPMDSKYALENRIRLARNTVIEMVQDRGFETTNMSTHPDLESFLLEFPNLNLTNFICTKKSSGEVIAVHFFLEDKVGKSRFTEIVQDYVNQAVNRVIFVTMDKLNSACDSYRKELKKSILVEPFIYKELCFNPTKHEFVHRHRIMGEDEVEGVLSQYMCKLSKMPKITSMDPIVRYLGAQKDDLMEILRTSKTTGSSYYYRVVRE